MIIDDFPVDFEAVGSVPRALPLLGDQPGHDVIIRIVGHHQF